MYAATQPIYILKEGTRRETGSNARSSNSAAARAIANTVKTMLGPKGMDKMLVDSRVPLQELQSATETANMILRIDDVIAAKNDTGGKGAKGGSDFDSDDF